MRALTDNSACDCRVSLLAAGGAVAPVPPAAACAAARGAAEEVATSLATRVGAVLPAGAEAVEGVGWMAGLAAVGFAAFGLAATGGLGACGTAGVSAGAAGPAAAGTVGAFLTLVLTLLLAAADVVAFVPAGGETAPVAWFFVAAAAAAKLLAWRMASSRDDDADGPLLLPVPGVRGFTGGDTAEKSSWGALSDAASSPSSVDGVPRACCLLPLRGLGVCMAAVARSGAVPSSTAAAGDVGAADADDADDDDDPEAASSLKYAAEGDRTIPPPVSSSSWPGSSPSLVSSAPSTPARLLLPLVGVMKTALTTALGLTAPIAAGGAAASPSMVAAACALLFLR